MSLCPSQLMQYLCTTYSSQHKQHIITHITIATTQGNWAMQIRADTDGKISALVGYNTTGGGSEELNRNFALEFSSGGKQFGVMFSHSHATDPSLSAPVFLGNDSVFSSLQTLRINARRPLSPTCRRAAANLCFGAGGGDKPFACRNCVSRNRTRLEDEGCDVSNQMADLVDVTCAVPPSDQCRAAVASFCPSTKNQDWNACGCCLPHAHI